MAVLLAVQEGEPEGRHVVIVDDLVQSGGTLIECHALLSSLGAAHGEQRVGGQVGAVGHSHQLLQQAYVCLTCGGRFLQMGLGLESTKKHGSWRAG
jgi:adenine/guanine phosphoribosyltransferase-like PRPP-binding protein